MINVFSRAVALKMANDKTFKEAYLDRLARVLDDEDMWRSYAYYLYTEYTPTYERAMEVLRSMQVRRVFNWHTTRTQLASMIFFADTSVLGWLFWSVSRHEPFTAGPAKAFVYYNSEKEFNEWKTWAAENALSRIEKRQPNDPCLRFKNHSWLTNKLEDTDNWWHKELRQNVYKRYSDALHSYANSKFRAACLSEPDFFAELRRLLTTLDPLDKELKPALLEYSETLPSGKDGELLSREWLCFAPLRQLRERIASALPSAWNFTWEAYYEQTK